MPISWLILLTILYVREPADFTGFPTLLLVITLFRLSLNIASTRLILLDGYAGQIIETFGSFVVRGNYVVGLVVFLILVIINFVVITKGAGRIAEVAARFTLDAMPGKQMAIDAELNAGVITEGEARTRRRKVEQEADFYGAMDGSSKFVRGDAIAAILITLINIVGGFAIGMMQKGMSLTEALEQFTILSIGDGLVSQVPALITSTAAGVLVTRAASKDELGSELSRQLLHYPRALWFLTGMLLVLCLIPGMPKLPFLFLALVTGFFAYSLKKSPDFLARFTGSSEAAFPQTTASHQQASPAATQDQANQQGAGTGTGSDCLESLLAVDTLQIELGYGLVHLADSRKAGDLLERVTGVRKTFAQEVGVIIPPIRLRDNLQLDSNQYRFLLKGELLSQGQLMPGHWLAMNATQSAVQLKGIPTVEPVFQLPATWITEVERKNAEISGYTVVDAPAVLVTHLTETIRRNCHEILSRQDVQNLLDHLKQTHPTVVSELVPNLLTVGQVQRILQNLLAEGLPIKNLTGILEKVSDHAVHTKNIDELSEHARRALGLQIARNFQDEKGRLHAITLDPTLEQQIAQGIRQSPHEISLTMEPRLAKHLIDSLSKRIQSMLGEGLSPVVLCTPQIRLAFRRFFETTFNELAVLSYSELPPRIEILNSGIITHPE